MIVKKECEECKANALYEEKESKKYYCEKHLVKGKQYFIKKKCKYCGFISVYESKRKNRACC